MILRFTITDKVQPKQSTNFGAPNGQVQRAYKHKKVIKFEDRVKLCFKLMYPNWDYKQFEGKALQVKIINYREVLKKFNKTQRALALQGLLRPISRPDTDNISKGIKDALNGLAFPDDSQVVDEYIQKFYAEEPYTVVIIKEIL